MDTINRAKFGRCPGKIGQPMESWLTGTVTWMKISGEKILDTICKDSTGLY